MFSQNLKAGKNCSESFNDFSSNQSFGYSWLLKVLRIKNLSYFTQYLNDLNAIKV